MNNLMPFVALMSLPKDRRRHLLPLAMSAAAGMPAAQSGALAVISADSAVRRESRAATAAATAEAVPAVTEVIKTVVAKGVKLTAGDFEHIPLARQAIEANPGILDPKPRAVAAAEDTSETAQESAPGRAATAKKTAPAKKSTAAKKATGSRKR